MIYSTKRLVLIVFQFTLLVCSMACNSTDKKKEEKEGVIEDKYDTSELSIQRGMSIFNQNCASCHNFNEKVIGPSLAGVTSKVSKEWFIDFIHSPQKVIESGDERGKELFTQYKTYMPSFKHIEGQELENLLGFIHRFSEAEKKNKSNRPGGILNPIPEKIPESELTLVIKEFLTVTPSSESIPVARINKLSAVKSALDERLFIGDLRGKLYEIIDAKTYPFLDLNVEMESFIGSPGWGTGLGSFDFHPEYDENGLFYTTHTESPKKGIADFDYHDSIPSKLHWVLTEWKMDNPAASKFSGSKREVLRVNMVTSAHGFQEITFNPFAKKSESDYGLLYLGIGDGVSALAGYSFLCDNPGKIWGSVIRIDPLGKNSKNGKYGIPQDNPFVDDPDKLGEIWSYGFRNPHRISWDESSGKVFVTNIGQHSLEEINLLQKGANYGWPFREGTFVFDVDANTEVVYPLPEGDSGFTYPVIEFDHDEANAVSGGFAYAGSKIPLLKNKYIFGDIPRGTLFYTEVSEAIQGKKAPIYKLGLELNGQATSLGEISENQRVDLRFGKDSSGELFIFTKSNGKVYRVVDCKKSSISL